MKKWLVFLSCLLIIAVIAIAVILNNNNDRINTLNQDLYNSRTEVNTLKEKSEEDKVTIEDLHQQIETLNADKSTLIAENENLNAENVSLTAEKDALNASMESLSTHLSSSQQKLQGVLYILTDGEQGNIEGVLAPFIKIYQDVSLENPYFDAVNHVSDLKLMLPREEEVFGVDEKATLGELAEGYYAISKLQGTRTEAAADLLQQEKTWLAAKAENAGTPADEADVTETGAAAEPAAEEPAEAAAEPEAEEPEEAAAEPAAEEPAETAAEPAAEEPAEAAAEPAAEEPAEAADEPTAEEPAEAEAEPAAEEPEAAAEPEEDENLILTRERLLSFCEAICYAKEWEMPEIVFPESDEPEANRGDLAIVLMKLNEAEK